MFWDDNDFILNNQYIKDWHHFPKLFSGNVIEGAGLVSNYYRPVLLTVFSVEWHLFGTAVFGWHAVNALVHALNAALIFMLLIRLFRRRWLAILVAGLFLIHPVQVEAVAYVNSFGDSLSFFLMLLSLLSFERALSVKERIFSSPWYYLSIFLFPLAVLSKETAIVLPGLVFAITFFSGDRGQFSHRLLKAILVSLPFLLLGICYMVLRAGPLNFQNTFNLYNEQNQFTESMWLRFLTFCKIISVYIGLLFWPQHLHMERSLALPHGYSADILFGAAVLAGLCAAILWNHKRRPILAFGMAWFLIALIPTSNIFIPINGLLYEHWLYVPIVGFGIALFAFFEQMVQSAEHRLGTSWRPLLIGLLVIFAILLCARTIKRILDWKSPISLYTQTLKYAPHSYRVLNNLGMSYADRRDVPTAIEFYEKAVSVDSQNPVALHNLGNAYQTLGDAPRAISYYKEAIDHDPAFGYSYSNLINILIQQGNSKEARAYLEKYLSVSARPLDVLELLAQLAIAEKEYGRALEYVNRALQVDPQNNQFGSAKIELERLIKTQ